MKIIQWPTVIIGIAVAAASAASSPPTLPPEQAVIVHFAYTSANPQPLFALEEQLRSAVNQSGAGIYDGSEHESDGNQLFNDPREGNFYFYGPNADRLFEVIEPILKKASIMKGAQVTKRYGGAAKGVKQVVVVIGA